MTEESLDTLGGRLRAARKAAGLTQVAVGKRFGITDNAVSQWENDDTKPEDGRVWELGELYGVSAHWLMTGRDEMPAQETRDMVIAAMEKALELSGAVVSPSKRFEVIDRVLRDLPQLQAANRPPSGGVSAPTPRPSNKRRS